MSIRQRRRKTKTKFDSNLSSRDTECEFKIFNKYEKFRSEISLRLFYSDILYYISLYCTDP